MAAALGAGLVAVGAKDQEITAGEDREEARAQSCAWNLYGSLVVWAKFG